MADNPFRTIVKPVKCNRYISHEDQIIQLGSCFAENISSRLRQNHFSLTYNPTGLLYNPLSILETLKRIEKCLLFSKEDLFYHNHLWKSFDFDSSFNSQNFDLTLNQINRNITESHKFFSNLSCLMLTFGTSYVYFNKNTKKVTANCQKMPSNLFERKLLSVQDIVFPFKIFFEKLLRKKPDLKIIITVSPVRHLRDKPHQNSVSKAHLISAVYELESSLPVYYFPSYEIMIDDLRDYRFYNSDMIHPSPTAIEYIWNFFSESCISSESQKFINDYAPILSSLNHRIQHRNHPSTTHFANSQIQLICQLSKTYPEINFSSDLEYFNRFLK